MRVRLSNVYLACLFSDLFALSLQTKELAELTGVSSRTVADWRRGKFTIPLKHLQHILDYANLSIDKYHPLILDNWWHTSRAGKKGGRAYTKKYKQVGTKASRTKGGHASYQTRKHSNTDIFRRNDINIPEECENLAEFVGILIGDGNMTKYQVSVSLSSLVDTEYSLHVAGLVQSLFGLVPSITKQKNANCLIILSSSVKLVEFLKVIGVLQGHKIRQNLDIPDWILADREYTAACIRGIFDTDGCIFSENHLIKEKLYSYPRWSLVSASPRLRETVYDCLLNFDLTAKIRNNRSINLEKSADIARYFRLIGSNNPKHLQRYINIGEVA